ncbi:MAG: glycosyltransferase family 4 protein, partial [Anaerolineae bacterium]|nr:glycosyltransferase family 4 protein [Anaerolineae bacterium]
TGTEAYAYFLITALIPLAAARNHTLRLYFNQAPPVGLFPEAPHVETAVLPQRRLWTHIRLARELRQNPPDVFFTPAHVIPLTYRGPSVATIHDLGYHHFPEAHPRKQLAYLRWSTRHNGRSATRIIADSQATKTDLIQIDHIAAEKIDVVYPGIDPELAPVSDKEGITAVLQKYGITPPYFLYIGTLQPRKNLVRLIQAFANSHVPHQLVLAGKTGWLSQPILDEIARVEREIHNSQFTIHNSQFVLPGYIEEADKPALLTAATALLFPSLYEGFGFPALEAQACATPVLTSNTSSMPEVVGDSAIQVDPLNTAAISNAIQNLASDSPLCQQLVQKGFENVKRFTWSETAVHVLNTVENAP